MQALIVALCLMGGRVPSSMLIFAECGWWRGAIEELPCSEPDELPSAELLVMDVSDSALSALVEAGLATEHDDDLGLTSLIIHDVWRTELCKIACEHTDGQLWADSWVLALLLLRKADLEQDA